MKIFAIFCLSFCLTGVLGRNPIVDQSDTVSFDLELVQDDASEMSTTTKKTLEKDEMEHNEEIDEQEDSMLSNRVTKNFKIVFDPMGIQSRIEADLFETVFDNVLDQITHFDKSTDSIQDVQKIISQNPDLFDAVFGEIADQITQFDKLPVAGQIEDVKNLIAQNSNLFDAVFDDLVDQITHFDNSPMTDPIGDAKKVIQQNSDLFEAVFADLINEITDSGKTTTTTTANPTTEEDDMDNLYGYKTTTEKTDEIESNSDLESEDYIVAFRAFLKQWENMEKDLKGSGKPYDEVREYNCALNAWMKRRNEALEIKRDAISTTTRTTEVPKTTDSDMDKDLLETLYGYKTTTEEIDEIESNPDLESEDYAVAFRAFLAEWENMENDLERSGQPYDEVREYNYALNAWMKKRNEALERKRDAISTTTRTTEAPTTTDETTTEETDEIESNYDLESEDYGVAFRAFIGVWKTMQKNLERSGQPYDEVREYNYALNQFLKRRNQALERKREAISTTTTAITTTDITTETSVTSVELDDEAFNAFIEIWDKIYAERKDEPDFDVSYEYNMAKAEFIINWEANKHFYEKITTEMPSASRPKRDIFHFDFKDIKRKPLAEKLVIGTMIFLVATCFVTIVAVLGVSAHRRHKMRKQMDSFLENTKCPVNSKVSETVQVPRPLSNEHLDIV